MSRAFFDTNILVYAFADDSRSALAKELLQTGGIITVQSLNELANVLRRKHLLDWPNVRSHLQAVRMQCHGLVILDETIHDHGLTIAQRHNLSIYDSMILAAALAAECDTLYSEDMQHGLLIDERLRIVNPFAVSA